MSRANPVSYKYGAGFFQFNIGVFWLLKKITDIKFEPVYDSTSLSNQVRILTAGTTRHFTRGFNHPDISTQVIYSSCFPGHSRPSSTCPELRMHKKKTWVAV